MAKAKIDFRKLKRDLKEYSSSWVTTVVERIIQDKTVSDEMKAEASQAKVRNVVNNVVRDVEWKVIVYKHMKELLVHYENEVKKVIQ